jgi:hypothetical protein
MMTRIEIEYLNEIHEGSKILQRIPFLNCYLDCLCSEIMLVRVNILHSICGGHALSLLTAVLVRLILAIKVPVTSLLRRHALTISADEFTG